MFWACRDVLNELDLLFNSRAKLTELQGAPGIATRSILTRSKDATNGAPFVTPNGPVMCSECSCLNAHGVLATSTSGLCTAVVSLHEPWQKN